ncbi:YkgJ family cysteine cluster protein [Algoriphagus hitonicola]|uniref:Putative zinc-or iron-chelating domain-containing protein n=1 Tax=Algoriphagus hitonicola TaxID=435880 RepID=A0A1I2SEZ8_9BACT|nr:YkgJ family cysteine cluster protein [Algoriphagus hitonicola]SFG51328.1 Putative zinc-or iron-chelating domain-containing protein [Algoriphagus hitonicola]
MNLFEKSQAVLELFGQLDLETKELADQGGLACISGCGRCCSSPKVTASPLEFLPLAFDFYEKGTANQALESLENLPESGQCMIYRKTSEDGSFGFCSNYANRGMICRIFGSAARRNKNGVKELITCKILKESKKEAFEELSVQINQGKSIPMATEYYSQLNDLDQYLSESYPINVAIRKAIEAVMRFQYYRQEEDASSV